MLKKLLIAGGGLLLLLIVLYVGLNSVYNKNTVQADSITSSIMSRAESYDDMVQAGQFNADTEQSVLNDKIREYEGLTQWAIRPHAKAQFEEVRAAAEAALASAVRWEAEAAQAQLDGEEAAARAMAEMLENQRRAAEQSAP